MANMDFEIYDGKTFKDLCKEVVDRSESKKNQLDTLFSEVRRLIVNSNDAQVFLPRIKEFLDTGVKNDEQLVKLISVIQRLQSSQIESNGGDTTGLSDEDKDQLIKIASKNSINKIKQDLDSILLPSSSSIS
jgi:hypothetical protein